MTSSSERFLNYTVELKGRYVETAKGKLLPMVGSGQLGIVAKQPGGPVIVSSGKVLHVPKLERIPISERQASLKSGLLLVKRPKAAHLGTRLLVCYFFSYSPSSGLYEKTVRKTKATPECALAVTPPPQRDIVGVNRLVARPSKHITRATAKATGIIIAGEWRTCIEYDQSKAYRYSMPRTTNHRTSERATLLYVDLSDPMQSEKAGGSPYVIMIVDDFSRFKVRKFLKTKSSIETAAALGAISRQIPPRNSSVFALFALTMHASLKVNSSETLIGHTAPAPHAA